MRLHSPLGEAVRGFARDVLQEGESALTRTDGGDAAVVHDFRKAMKRWRALLRLLEPLLGAEARELRVVARDLARDLAAARDGQSALDGLTDLRKTEHPLSERTWGSIRARLDQARQAAETTTLTRQMRERMRATLADASQALAAWPFEDLTFRRLADGLTTAYRRARRAIPAKWDQATDEELHTLRQRVVVHRYQMQVVESLWPRLGRVWVAEAQRLRDRLGSYQDLVVLTQMTAAHQPLAPWRSRLTPLIRARQAVHVEAATLLAARLFAERPRAFRTRQEALWESQAAEPSGESDD